MKKKPILICLLIMIMILSFCFAEEYYSNEIIIFDYMITDNGAVITGYNGESANIRIPSFLVGYPVIGIDKYAFYNSEIKQVSISEGVQYIGSYAFATIYLEYIDLPDTLKIIGDYAFSGTCIKQITLPDSVTQKPSN